MKKILFLSLLIISGASCKKGDIDFTMKGTVSDATFGGALEGATITLRQIPIGSGTNKIVGEATLSADGKYSFTFAREKIEKYVVTISKTNYFIIENDIPFSEFSPEDDLEKNYSTTAKSWVKLVFSGGGPTTAFKFTKQQGKTGCSECCPAEEHTLVGAVDTVFFCVNDANTNYSYLYNEIGTINQGIESVLTTAFDTATITKTY